MKKKLSLLIALISIFGFSVSVNALPAECFLDFESYSGTGIPPGMSGGNISEIKAVRVDEEHGVSVGVTAPGLPTYGFDNAINSGRLVLGFDIARADFDMNFRIHVKSEKSNTDAHSLFYMSKKGAICGANTAAGAWTFPELVKDIALNQWYNINILIDFESDNVYYYVDGKLMGGSKLAFEDLKVIYFRTEDKSANTVPYIYLDNLEIKYVKSEKIVTSNGNTPVKAGGDTVKLLFGDSVDKSSLSEISAYYMGTNPVELEKQKVDCSIESVSGKEAVVKFKEQLKENSTYKLEIPGAESIFGELYANDYVYFSTTRTSSLGYAVNADFSAATNSSNKITVPNDGEWLKSATSVYLAKDADLGESVVGFKRNDNELVITRKFTQAYDKDLDISFKLKSAKENIVFRCYDSEENILEMLDVKADGFYFGETKLADITAGEWNDIKIHLDSENKTLDFDINGTVTEDVLYDAIKDIVKIDFCQYNTEGSTGSARAMNYMADFAVKTMLPQISAQKVYFENEAGEIFYTEDKIPSDVSKIMIEFSDDVLEDTLSNGVKLINCGEEEEYSGEYNKELRIFTINLPQYLAGDNTYTMEVTEDVLNSVGAPISAMSGSFTTEKGFFKGNKLDISVEGDEVILTTEIIHTDASYKNVYLVYAAYKDDLMVAFDYTKLTPEDGQRKVSVNTDSYILPEGTNKVSAFLWEGFGKSYGMMNPVLGVKTVNLE